MANITDDTTHQFQIPDYQTGTNEPAVEDAAKLNHDAETPNPANTWTEADADHIAQNLTGENIIESLPHDERRWRAALLQEEFNEAEEDVMRRQREAYFNERELRRLEQENTTEAMLAIDDTQNYVITLRELHKKPGSELQGISHNV